MNPFEPPQGGDKRRPTEPLKIRVLAFGMAGIGLWSAFHGVTRPHGISVGWLFFAALSLGLARITWEKP